MRIPEISVLKVEDDNMPYNLFGLVQWIKITFVIKNSHAVAFSISADPGH
jgi:hypothetical protein